MRCQGYIAMDTYLDTCIYDAWLKELNGMLIFSLSSPPAWRIPLVRYSIGRTNEYNLQGEVKFLTGGNA